MVTCVAYGCTNRSTSKIPGITFHMFPKDELLRSLWIIAIRRRKWSPTRHSRLCSAHFSEDMIDRTSVSCVRLRDNAVPTIFEVKPKYFHMEQNLKKLSSVQSCADPPAAVSCLNTECNQLEKTDNHENNDYDPDSDEALYKIKADEFRNLLDLKNKKIKILHQKLRRYKKQIEILSLQLKILQIIDGDENDISDI